MNTIPTIFNESPPSYTAVGGKERLAATGLSAIVLNRPGYYSRSYFFQELEKTGFDNVISLEASSECYDLESLTGRFPFVRFILPHTPLNLGQRINLAAGELDSPLFFVLWNDLKMVSGGTAQRMAERLGTMQNGDKNGDKKISLYKRLCTVPVIQNSRFQTLPTMTAPVIYKKKIKTLRFAPDNDGLSTLYPFDGIGIYDRERFIRLGGFDVTLKSKHWQLMDFGFRSYLWGEDICVSQQIKISYDGPGHAEANTAEDSYRRFYFKNLAPAFRGDYAHLPLRSYIKFLFSSQSDPFAAWEDFSESGRWVKINRYRWRCDAQTLAGRWSGISAPSGSSEESGLQA